MPRLPHSFCARAVLEVAPELVGCLLVREGPGRALRVGRIVEVEAYRGDGSDPASHAHRGETARNRSMFGPPGHLYVYRSMGIHACANLVCEGAGRGAAVLLRAVEPLEGLPLMRRRRARARRDRDLCSGPGRLAEAFGIDLSHDGRCALRGAVRVELPEPGTPAPALARGPRVGIRAATERPYRFFEVDNPSVTRTVLNRRARRIPPTMPRG